MVKQHRQPEGLGDTNRRQAERQAREDAAERQRNIDSGGAAKANAQREAGKNDLLTNLAGAGSKAAQDVKSKLSKSGSGSSGSSGSSPLVHLVPVAATVQPVVVAATVQPVVVAAVQHQLLSPLQSHRARIWEITIVDLQRLILT